MWRSPLLVTENLAVGYGRRTLLADLQLTLGQGQFICLIGANGSGKSTLLRTLAGIDKPRRGKIWLNGQELTRLTAAQRATQLSLVLTDRLELDWLSVTELVGLGRYPYTDWQGRLGEEDRRIVREAIAAVGMTELSDKWMTQISDGERQKAMIARALAQQTALMFLDEPTAFLDLPRRVEIMHLLRSLAHDQQRSILMSTHDLDLALRSADYLWLITAERQLVVGTPEELVLQGYLGTTFSSDAFQFDQVSGQFQLQHPRRSPIICEGAGLITAWTTRALTRLGFELVATDAPLRLQVETDPPQWILHHDGDRPQRFSSLSELSDYLQATMRIPLLEVE